MTEKIPLVNLDLLILFTRLPQPGKVKTRLIPALGAVGAAALHRQLTEHILHLINPFIKANNAALIIYADSDDILRLQHIYGLEYHYRTQSQGDLGHRMSAAFADSLPSDRRRVVLIGSDCPGISEKLLSTAFSHLDHYDLVLGPATDGGYYLIGLSQPCPALFQDISWGTAEVLALTLARAASLGLRTILLEPLDDIDRPEDLPIWEKLLSNRNE